MTNFKNIGYDVRVHEQAIITRPELVEIGNHVAIDMWVYLSTQAKIGAVPSTVGSEMSALLSNTKDLENNSELAAAMIPSMSGGSGKKTTNVSAQSVTYNSNNIPDRTSWMTTPLANWSL